MSIDSEDPLAIIGKTVLYRDANGTDHYGVAAGYGRMGLGVGRTTTGKLVKRKTTEAVIINLLMMSGDKIKPSGKNIRIMQENILAVRWFNKDIPIAEWVIKRASE